MTKDYFNGLTIIPFKCDRSILSSIAVSGKHPWRRLYQHRSPSKSSSPTPWQETIRLCDVMAFRKSTAEKARANDRLDQVDRLTAGFARLSTSSPSTRPVIYRYIDVIKNSFAILEATHYELFMPDRSDLRFLAVQFTSVPSGTVEGDCFHLSAADLLSGPLFAVKLGELEYPVMWEVKQYENVDMPNLNEQEALSYIVKKVRGVGATAISDHSDHSFVIRDKLFSKKGAMNEHSLVRVTMKDLITAQLYPVEPPLPPPPLTNAQQHFLLDSLLAKDLAAVYRDMKLKFRNPKPNYLSKLKSCVGQPQLRSILTEMDNASTIFGRRSEYDKHVEGVRRSSYRAGCVVTAVRALSATEADRIKDRLRGFNTYGQTGDLELMSQLFRLGSHYRIFVADKTDVIEAGEMRIDEGIVLRTIRDEGIKGIKNCRLLLDCIYGRTGTDKSKVGKGILAIPFCDGTELLLNPAQSRAVRMYAGADGPRVFCILSPPGSGKTTVAAAMAAEVARTTVGERKVRRKDNFAYESYSSVQLLLSVQNVAVDNMGAALKKLNYGGGQVYNMKSMKKLNPYKPAPYDMFDLMSFKELEKWKNDSRFKWMEVDQKNGSTKKTKLDARMQEELDEYLARARGDFEKRVFPKIILSTVEMVLQKMYTKSKLRADLEKVERVIIDETSLMTEAALFAIIRRFPEARIVLIGDHKQLPPFMYDKKMLGHELAGRAALSVAMKTGKVPVVELNEVYRAPPTLVAPYNRLAYGGKLVSRKAEEYSPLSDIKLMGAGAPQLLLIDVDGKEEQNKYTMSLSNAKELNAVVRLLKKFPRGTAKNIMIICLYNDQKNRLQDMLENECKLKRMRDERYTVLTVDSAQGKEAPIVILMTTRAQRATGFFCSKERCNVAVSRQQQALIILGKGSLLTKTAPWSTVVNGDDFTRIKDSKLK